MTPDDEISTAVATILAARPTFSVGDRVRVTAAIAECQQDWEPTIEQPGHPDGFIGLTGTVDRIDTNRMAGLNHPVSVEVDRRDLGFIGFYMNATELEHLTDD